MSASSFVFRSSSIRGVLTALLLCCGHVLWAQVQPAKHVKLMAAGDSFYQINEFKAAAQRYAQVNLRWQDGKRVNLPMAHYNAAKAWSLAGSKDSAFAQLRLLVEDKQYDAFALLNEDQAFSNLYTDERWSVVLLRARRNATLPTGALPPSAEVQAFSSTVFYPLSAQVKAYVSPKKDPFAVIKQGPYRFFYRPEHYSAAGLEQLKTQLNESYTRVLDILPLEKYDRGINLILVASATEMAQVTGKRSTDNLVLPEHDCMVLHHQDQAANTSATKSLFQLLATQTMGNRAHALLVLGGGHYAQNNCADRVPDFHSKMAAYLASKDELVPLNRLLQNFDASVKKNARTVDLQSTALFQYLYEKYGAQSLQALWLQGFADFETIYSMNLEAFEKEWLSYLDTMVLSKDTNFEKLIIQGC